MRLTSDKALQISDLAATLLFAIQGATTALLAGADLFGIVVIGFVTALGGGVIRDVILGERPAAAFSSVRYPLTALLGAAIVILTHGFTPTVSVDLLVVLDALGLGLFAVTGTAKALDHRINWLSAIMLGTLTGCGGGALRDVLLNRTPEVLLSHIYAVAAATAAAAVIVLLKTSLPRWAAMWIAAAACVALRLLAVGFDWNLPVLAP